ncbi:MAG TPA: hypothetical protein VHF86_03025, partial [Xanthomonadaceae bacterium]|nr:hypothetical protein [Xanthomonadaceae bacterium]
NHMIRLALRRRNGVKNSGFRAIRRSMVQRLPSEADSGPLISALLFQSSDRIGMVRVSHQPSALPASRYTPWSLLTLSFGVVAHLGRVAAGRSGVSEPASAEREAHHAAFVRRAIRAGQEQASRA